MGLFLPTGRTTWFYQTPKDQCHFHAGQKRPDDPNQVSGRGLAWADLGVREQVGNASVCLCGLSVQATVLVIRHDYNSVAPCARLFVSG